MMLTIYIASAQGNLEAVKEFLKSGVSVNARHPMRGTVPLHHAVFEGRLELVKELLAANADPSIQATDSGYTCLHSAAARGQIEMARLLLDAGVDPSIKTHSGETALDLATKRGYNHDMITLLSNADQLTITKFAGK